MWYLLLHKKLWQQIFFYPLFCCCFWILDPGWVKIRIRDKHPGSATLRDSIESGSTALLVTCVPAPVSHAAAEVAAIQRFEGGVLLLPPGEPGPLQHLRQLVRLRPREHHPEPSTANEKDLKLAHRGTWGQEQESETATKKFEYMTLGLKRI